MDVYLSTGDLARLTERHPNTLMDWANRGLVHPLNNAAGYVSTAREYLARRSASARNSWQHSAAAGRRPARPPEASGPQEGGAGTNDTRCADPGAAPG